MRLNLLLSLTLALGLTLLFVRYEDSRRASASPRQVINACQTFDPDTSEQCGSNACNPRFVMTNSGFSSGAGIHSLNATTIICSFGNDTEQVPCQNEPVTQLNRFNDPGCCDLDGDGYWSTACGFHDCNDQNPNINPGRPEICGDGVDNDCSGGDACCDLDGDGYTDWWCGGTDCDDWNASVNPGAWEVCDDWVDNNCNGIVDGRMECREECDYRCSLVGAYCDPNGNCYTPVVIDTGGDGVSLSDGAGGVDFDIDGDGAPNRLAWTLAGSDDSWLALDRNGNGRVDDGTELFGDRTPQPASSDPNGFRALAEFDTPARGGNADGVIDARDSAFASLRLWRDADHDGVCYAGELHTLASQGVASISLDYRESKRRDQHGNVFRYRAKVESAGRPRAGRWAWDVFLAPPR